MGDAMAWQAVQLSRRRKSNPQPTNPNPPGMVRPGSGTDVLLRFLERNPCRWFLHQELVLTLGRSKGEIDWAVRYLAQQGLAMAEMVDMPGRKAVMRYRLGSKPGRIEG